MCPQSKTKTWLQTPRAHSPSKFLPKKKMALSSANCQTAFKAPAKRLCLPIPRKCMMRFPNNHKKSTLAKSNTKFKWMKKCLMMNLCLHPVENSSSKKMFSRLSKFLKISLSTVLSSSRQISMKNSQAEGLAFLPTY